MRNVLGQDMLRYPANASVIRIAACDVRAGDASWDVSCAASRDAPWRYAQVNAAAIDAAWEAASRVNPAYFNGIVYLTDQLSISGDRLAARLVRTEFKSYLHWRLAGFPEAGVLDGFGSALLRSGDGAVVLGRQRDGNVNAGLAYLPGGFIDSLDVAADGRVDIASSIARELTEETGLALMDLEREPGFLVTQSRAQLSFAVSYRSPLDAASLKERIEMHIAGDGQSELVEAVIVRSPADLNAIAMPVYARVLLAAVLGDASCPARPTF